MLKHVMAAAAVERIRVDERAGTANVAARIFAVPVSTAGRSAEHAKSERVGHDTFDRSDGQVRHQSDGRSASYVQVQGY